jgi:hypothetical protein
LLQASGEPSPPSGIGMRTLTNLSILRLSIESPMMSMFALLVVDQLV